MWTQNVEQRLLQADKNFSFFLLTTFPATRLEKSGRASKIERKRERKSARKGQSECKTYMVADLEYMVRVSFDAAMTTRSYTHR